MREKLLKRLAHGWPSQKAPARTVQTQTAEKLFDSVASCAARASSEKDRPSLIGCSGIVFHDSEGDIFIQNGRGVPRVNDTIYRMAGSTFSLLRPVLRDFAFEVNAAGLMQLLDVLFQLAQEPKFVDAMVRSLHGLIMGGEGHVNLMEVSFTERYTSHMIWMGIMTGNLSYSSTWLYYLQHLGLPPLERARRSGPRTMAFTELVLQQALLYAGLWRSQRVFWVLGATDAVEGQQAREGFFEDLMAFREMKATVFLVGDDLPSEPAANCGLSVEVYGRSWGDLAETQVPRPTMVFAFNSGLGTLSRSAGNVLRVCFALSMGEKPPVIVSTCRCESEGAVERAVFSTVGIPQFMSANFHNHVRNLYSGMGGHPDIDYDDNGWWVASGGNVLPKEMYMELFQWLMTDFEAPDGVYTKVRNDMEPPPQEEPAEQPPTADADAPAAPPAAAEKAVAAAKAEAAAEGAEVADSSPATESSDLAKAAQPDESAALEDGQVAKQAQQSLKSPAVFWGILDLKYDPSKLPGDRVKVLETGDGRTSRFSGYGASIKENFIHDHRLEETLQRSVLTENKKLTHDTIVDAGYSHLRPRQIPFPKEYNPSLAESIVAAFGFSQGDKCVLKLCNRTRGAGVIPVPVEGLDAVLRQLLSPPEDIDAWLAEQPEGWAMNVVSGCFEEQMRHWWSNECPIFVVEELCYSMPTEKEGKFYDGTMRVGFTLHREERRRQLTVLQTNGVEGKKKSDSSDEDEERRANPRSRMIADVVQETVEVWDEDRPWMELFRPELSILRVQWLGGYWKLPLTDIESEDLREKVVSVAKQGTAPVPLRELYEVYAGLGDMVARLFGAKEMSNASLLRRYSEWPEFGAFAVSRLACSMRGRDRSKSHGLLKLAQTHLSKYHGRAKDVVDSYVVRNFGVHHALQGSWSSAQEEFLRSLRSMPSNATARFLVGIAHMEMSKTEAAINSMEEALLLDPDFKAPYAGLGALRLRKGDYQKAADISRAGLARHPYTPQCSYNLGAATFALACKREESFTKLWATATKTPASSLVGAAPTTQAPLQAWPQQASKRPAVVQAPPNVRPLGPESRYEVVHIRILVRATPSRSAQVVGVAARGRPVYGVACEVDGEAWVRIRGKACEELRLTVKEAWMLMKGKYLGFGPLLIDMPSSGQEVVLQIRHEEKPGRLILRVANTATIKEVKDTIATEIGKAHFAPPLWRKVGNLGLFKCEDDELIGGSSELVVRGKVMFTLPKIILAPGGSTDGLRKEEVATAPAAGGPPQSAAEMANSRRLVAAYTAEAATDILLQQLRTTALEALETAHNTRTRDLPWTERDERMLARLREPGLLEWPKEDLPRDGWRVLNFRP